MKRYFIAGLLFWLPIWATYVVLKFLVDLLDVSLKLLPYQYQPDQLIGFHIPGLGVVFTLIIVFLTGLLVTNIIGHRLVSMWDRLVARIPLIRSIHSAVKQVLNTLMQPRSDSFRKVLLVEYPRKGVWSIGFLTSSLFNQTPHEGETVMVFIPTTPNPTSGFLIIAPKDDTIELDMTIEEAFKIIISLGVVMPDLNGGPTAKHVDVKYS